MNVKYFTALVLGILALAVTISNLDLASAEEYEPVPIFGNVLQVQELDGNLIGVIVKIDESTRTIGGFVIGEKPVLGDRVECLLVFAPVGTRDMPGRANFCQLITNL